MPTALTDRGVAWLLHLTIFELVRRTWSSSGPTYHRGGEETGSSSFGLRTPSEVRFHDPNDNPLPARIPKNSASSCYLGRPVARAEPAVPAPKKIMRCDAIDRCRFGTLKRG